jgi:hypothetical protein
MKRIATLALGAMLALAVNTAARADVPNMCTFNYTSSMIPSAVPTLEANGDIKGISGGSGIGLDADELPGGTDIVLTTLATDSAALGHFSSGVSTFTINLAITDRMGATEILTFDGGFDGSLTPTAASTSTTVLGQTKTTTTLIDAFTVKVNTYVPVGPPTSTTPGSIGARVTCHGAVPEPGTMALLGLGFLPMAAVIRRRRS